MSILRNTLNQSGFKILACTFLALSLTACGGTDSDKTEKPNDIIPPSLEVPVSPEAPTDPVTPAVPEATPALNGEWSEISTLDTKTYSTYYKPWQPMKSIADDNGNVFVTWIGDALSLWVARNTEDGWEEPVHLASEVNKDSFRWVVTPKGDAFVFWQEGFAGKPETLALKLAHYSVETKEWANPITITSLQGTLEKTEDGSRDLRLEKLEDLFINIDAKGDILLTWSQVLKLTRKDGKDTKDTQSKTTKYTYTDFVNRKYILNSGLDTPHVFWTSLNEDEEVIVGRTSPGTIRTTVFEVGRIENVSTSPQKVFVVSRHTGNANGDSYAILNTITCNGDMCASNGSRQVAELKDITSDSTTSVSVNLSSNAHSQAFATFYYSKNQWGVHYNPDTGWGKPKSIELQENPGLYPLAPVSLINNNGQGFIAWNSTNQQKIHVNSFVNDWQSDNTELHTGVVNNYVHASLSTTGVPYAMWYVEESLSDANGSYVTRKNLRIKAHSLAFEWKVLPDIEQAHQGTYTIAPYQLAYDKQGNPIAVWNSYEQDEDYKVSGIIKVSRFKPD